TSRSHRGISSTWRSERARCPASSYRSMERPSTAPSNRSSGSRIRCRSCDRTSSRSLRGSPSATGARSPTPCARWSRRPSRPGHGAAVSRPRGASGARRSSRSPATEAQAAALAAIVGALDSPRDTRAAAGAPRGFLLHGVTASGKTEVYLRAAAETLARGRGVIVLVPEIVLTAQVVARFIARFGDRVALLHSALSAGERFDEWRRVLDGAADVVIGSRSALFAPLERVGLVVVDEEQEPSYKQESAPRYHAVDAALALGRLAAATVVLGSATPRGT